MPFLPPYFKGKATAFVPGWLKADAAQTDGLPSSAPVVPPYGSVSEKQPLLVKGGHLILPRERVLPLDIKIHDGKIVLIGENLSDNAALTLDAKGKYIVPGVIDPHVHLGIFTDFDTEIVTETRSALLNGVTTIGIYLGGQESYLGTLEETIQKIERHSFCDVFIHLVILTRKQLEEIPLYHSRYGISSFKSYLCGIPGLIPEVEDDFLLELMEKIALIGQDAVLNIHAENHRIVDLVTKRLKKEQPFSDSLALWEKTHPCFAEAEAIQRASFLSKESGARIYFVHLSCAESIRAAAVLKKGNQNLFFETTSPYLTLDLEQDLDLLYKMVPPIRTREDQKALWEGLADDTLDTIGTDHTPMSSGQKKTSVNIWDVPPGYPAVGTHLSSLLDKAKEKNFPLAKLVDKITRSPAEVFGLYPRKGAILPGSDADLVIIDPALRKEATPETAASRSDYCLHQGRALTGWPVAIVRAGKIMTRETFDHDEPHGVKGRYLRRA
jgi:dihydropyrimidinase